MKLIVSDASNAKGDTLTGTCTKNTTTTFTRPAESDWTGKFYKIVYNVTVAGTRNQYVEFSEAKFYTDEAAAVLSPTFVPEEGKVVDGAFTESFTLTMSCETADATIQYTLDGSNPAEATAMTYSEPITIPAASTQVRAIAIKGGDKSFETEQVYAFINTPATAYTVTEAKAIIDKGLGLDHELYGKGTIKSIKGYYNNKYITYNITDGENDLTVYNGLGLEKAAFGAETDLNIGDQVVVYGKLVKFSGTYEFNMDNYLISLIPAPKMYTITVTVNDDAMGTVTGAGEYKENTEITLTATAKEGYKFVNWTIGKETKTDNPLTISVTDDMNITANFEEEKSLTPATWYSQESISGTLDGKDVKYAITYEITRNADKTLTIKMNLNDEAAAVVGMVPQLFIAGTYAGNFNNGEFTTSATYTDGDVLEMWFYMVYAGGATVSAHFNYTVGSSNTPATAIDAAVVAPKATKRLINGVLVIEKDGVLYTAQGAKL